MPKCSNCGIELPEGAKFCLECGTPTTPEASDSSVKKRKGYDGEIHKCPFCGEIINSFETKCHSCGNELRGIEAASKVQEFAKQLETRKGRSKIGYIRNFPLPNTKEDILEFLILAVSNIDSAKEPEDELNAAWCSKYDQAYQKAVLIHVDSDELKAITELHNQKIVQSKQNHHSKLMHERLGRIGFCVFIIILYLFLFVHVIISDLISNRAVEKENARLQAIVETVNHYIEDGNYAMARVETAQIIFGVSTEDDSIREKWDKTRAELYDAIDRAEGVKPSTSSPEAGEGNETNNQPDNQGDVDSVENPDETDFLDDVESGVNAVSQWWDSLWE